jgi:salicylate hydroxylase
MALEDGAFLGALFSRSTNPRDPVERRRLLAIYEKCRKARTNMVVSRGNLQQYLYHLHDGPEQQERDRKMQAMEPGEALAWRDSGLSPQLLGYEVDRDIDRFWHLQSEEILAKPHVPPVGVEGTAVRASL